MKRSLLYTHLFLFISTTAAWGQATKPVQYNQELRGFFATTGEIPFWMRANQYGIVPRGQAIYSLRSAWSYDYRAAPKTRFDSLTARRRKFDWGWGFEAVGNTGSVTQVLIPEAYIKGKVGPLEAYAGRRREVFGLGGDSPLSSGSFIWSGNALPFWKAQLALPDYWPAKSFIAVKGSYAHGWFTNGFVSNSFLHQKTFYVRLGKATSLVKAYAGFNHQVQWAGRTQRLTNDLIVNDQFPNSLQAYWWAVSGSSLNTQNNVDEEEYSAFDRGNRVGNHLGTIDVGAEVNAGAVSVLLYRQSIYEDGSLYYLINIVDGLHGLRIRNQPTEPATGFRLNEVTLEFLNTYSQGGDAFKDTDPKRRGRDDYFNHGQYRDGWSYGGRTIGTPFIAPVTELRDDIRREAFFSNNRVRVYHAGISGEVGNLLTVSLKASYSQNAGTYQNPFQPVRNQRSAIATVGIRLGEKGFRATASAAIDRGDLYTSNTGFMLGLVKQGNL